MPHYLRLYSSPTIEIPSKGPKSKGKDQIRPDAAHGIPIRFKLTCTTDLGDSYYEGDLDIKVQLLDSSTSSKVLASGQLQWKSGSRVLSDVVMLQPAGRIDLEKDLWVCFSARHVEESTRNVSNATKIKLVSATARSQSSTCPTDVLDVHKMPEVVSVCARLFINAIRSSQDPDRQVCRRLSIPRQASGMHKLSEDEAQHELLSLLVYEEMGESIARHIWDAALALLTFLSDELALKEVDLQALYQIDSRNDGSQLEILELGSGCGTVGLGLARFIPNARFVLTDLPEAMDILHRNLRNTQELGFAQNTMVEAKVLDWNSALTTGISEAISTDSTDIDLASLSPDLVIVSDCTYNSSYFEALIATLLRVVKQKHRTKPNSTVQVDVLVAYKVRHESESEFFTRMHDAGFRIAFQQSIAFPDRSREAIGLDLETAEIFGFVWQLDSSDNEFQ